MAALENAGLSAKPDNLVAERSYAAEEAQKVAEAKAVEAKAASEAEEEIASIFRQEKSPEGEPIPSPGEWKYNAMLEAYKRRNRISKAVRIVIANILAVPAYALFQRIGLDWASWAVTIVVLVYSMIILVSPGTPDAWRAHLEKWKSDGLPLP